jgi:hypothetical protein
VCMDAPDDATARSSLSTNVNATDVRAAPVLGLATGFVLWTEWRSSTVTYHAMRRRGVPRLNGNQASADRHQQNHEPYISHNHPPGLPLRRRLIQMSRLF